MRNTNTLILALIPLFLFISNASISANSTSNPPVAIVIHAGAGNINRSTISKPQEKQYKAKLQEALLAGHKILKTGGSSLDAVESAIKILEDSPLFNAGKGAVYTHDETHELDASIMNGETLAAGAVAGVTTIKNPITLARAIMEKSNHVLLSGQGAEIFAKEQNITTVDNHYFDTQKHLERLREIKQRDPSRFKLSLQNSETLNDYKFGTVGAVALDQKGNLAAGTSTGGMTNKRYGRIGDSPIIGAGTYADNQSCAVSATGHGEYFIRHVVAYSICISKKLNNITLAKAAKTVIQKTLREVGGEGGVIAMDAQGSIVMEFNTSGMFRGSIDKHNTMEIELFK